MSRPRLAVVGAGVVGLAHAWAGARLGYDVTVFERDAVAAGASVRNFGLGLLLGQPQGDLYELARHSRSLWLELLPAMGCWYKAQGSLVVARNAVEWAVLEAFQAELGQQYGTRLLNAAALSAHDALGLGALQSGSEIAFESRQVIPALAGWLAQMHGVRFHYGTQINAVELPVLQTSQGRHHADRVIVCTGHDFQTLYPAHFSALDLARCGLQMLRVVNPGITLGPALMTGLSTLHYGAFTQSAALAEPLARLHEQLACEQPELLEHGIHLIIQQVGLDGDLIIGDSHHYGADITPFSSAAVDTLLLDLAESLLGRRLQVQARWQGVYAKGPRPYEIMQPEPGVQLVTITAGVGMSIALALAERVLSP
ncbi:oxidoreductase [Chitinimonas prasina]|uniref:Oxidoreductase n=1 Tax=Chitinimonas prasina TaxID=1434937 RepID=A0ABQ5YJI8_9NEIS|nr:TIGR03364 family FAD-dependent oxidoreductase [Chitinimonas prasina]GLR13510.1 oxidoreductase [Chitinimonas prasina]